ncbi:MAG: BspA family leucine-rich repeat surface protein [Clostridiales bacterium]|nr:BspA family leucine-rich repeat surface protein [Clostridiales bacterium]
MKRISTETLRKILSAVLVMAILLAILIQWIKTNYWYKLDSKTGTLYISGEIADSFISPVRHTKEIRHLVATKDCSLRCRRYGMFKDIDRYLPNLESIDLSRADTSGIESMSGMFEDCNTLTSIDISGIDTSKVTTMDRMFKDCIRLSSLDLSWIDTSKVTTMESMFYECRKLKALDLSHFDTSNVKNMCDMFNECKSLSELDISNFNTSHVRSMSEMFKSTSLEVLDLSSFDVSSSDNFWYMFEDCSLLETIYVSDKWTISMTKEKLKEEESTEMFIHCDSLVGGEGTPYSYVGYDIEFARVDQGEEQPGYFTLKE